jgi:septal ring factor EnvC (AmiA/AmiB activator)
MSTFDAAIEQIKSSPYPTYALRAWLTALLAQTRTAQVEMEANIRNHESEIERLRQHLAHAGEVLKSLENSIERVDSALQKQRDIDMNRPRPVEEVIIVTEEADEHEEHEGQKKK